MKTDFWRDRQSKKMQLDCYFAGTLKTLINNVFGSIYCDEMWVKMKMKTV